MKAAAVLYVALVVGFVGCVGYTISIYRLLARLDRAADVAPQRECRLTVVARAADATGEVGLTLEPLKLSCRELRRIETYGG